MSEGVTTSSSGSGRHEGRVKIAGVLIIAGLLVELVTFSWSTPTGFVLMLGAGGGLVLVGMLLYAWAAVAPRRRGREGSSSEGMS